MNKNTTRRKEIIISACVLLVTPLIVTCYAWLGIGKIDGIIRAAALSLVASVFCVYSLEKTRIMDLFYLDNGSKQGCFLFYYLLGILVAVIAIFRSPFIIPLPFFSVMIMLYSGFFVALTSLFSLTIACYIVAPMYANSFAFLFASSLAALILFHDPKKPLRYVAKSICVLFVTNTMYVALELVPNYSITPQDIIDPVIGSAISFILMLVALRLYSQKNLETYDHSYEYLNDPENPLLMRLKNEMKEEYIVAIHTAYLADKVCGLLNRDRIACKCIGYYHRIGVLNKGKSAIETLAIVNDNGFPPKAVALIKDYYESAGKPVYTETAICILANDIVSSIRYMSRSGKNLDYNRIIDYVFNQRKEAGIFDRTDMRMSEITEIVDFFKGERLYYDFLH